MYTLKIIANQSTQSTYSIQLWVMTTTVMMTVGNVNNVKRMKESVIDKRFKIGKDNGKL